MRNKEVEEKLKRYIDLNIFTNADGELIDNKVGLVQDLYDFVVLDYLELLKEACRLIGNHHIKGKEESEFLRKVKSYGEK